MGTPVAPFLLCELLTMFLKNCVLSDIFGGMRLPSSSYHGDLVLSTSVGKTLISLSLL